MRESELLSYVYEANAGLGQAVSLPPGDDMGAVRVGSGPAAEDVLVTVDQVADGVHVDLATMSVEQVGRKAMMRNLSDVAAMGATPVAAVAAVCLPRDFGQERARRLFDAMRQTGAKYACPLMGGDISMWEGKLVCSVTVLARCEERAVLRSGAKVGDAIYVTGELGGSRETVGGRTHHLDFEPRIEAGKALARLADGAAVHSMIDLSDGLAKDLQAICRASGKAVGAVIEVARLPISAGARQAAARDGVEPWRHAVGDGEDYELLFTAAADTVGDQVAGAAITRLGEVVAGGGEPRVRFRLADGSELGGAELGWEHRS